MTDHKKARNDQETMLLALDQISQTIDVMTSVVKRLRHHLEDQGTVQTASSKSPSQGFSEEPSQHEVKLPRNQTVH